MTYTRYPQKGYARKSWRAYWNDVQEVKGSKAKLLYIGTPQFFKYYNSVNDKCYVLAKRTSDNLSDHYIRSIISGGPLALTAVDKVKYLADFFDKKLLRKYDYHRKEAVMIDSTLCIAVAFKPVSVLKNVGQPWNKKVEFPLYSGTIYISRSDFSIVKFECQFARNNRTTSYIINEPWQIFPGEIALEVNYKKRPSGKWFLDKVKTKQSFAANSSMKWFIPENYICTREFFVTRINPDHIKIPENTPLLRDINNAQLRTFTAAFNSAAWAEFDQEGKFSLTKKERDALEMEVSLEKQFETNK